MVNDTFVVPSPAAMVPGVKVAVAPGGRPLALRVMAEEKVLLPTGVTTKPNVAEPPGCTVAEVAEPLWGAMLKEEEEVAPVTVRVAPPETLPELAWMVVVPAATPMARPPLEMVAVAVLLLDHVTVVVQLDVEPSE